VKCMLCGKTVNEDSAQRTGYVFSEKGEENVPSQPCFCSDECVDKFADEYANPIFQNRRALSLFRERFPEEYRDILRKPKLFLETERGIGEKK